MRTDLIEVPKTLSEFMFTEVHDLVYGIARIQLGANDHSVYVCNQASLVGGILTANHRKNWQCNIVAQRVERKCCPNFLTFSFTFSFLFLSINGP